MPEELDSLWPVGRWKLCGNGLFARNGQARDMLLDFRVRPRLLTLLGDQGTRRERIKILGNGVCPPVMEAIVETIMQHAHLIAGLARLDQCKPVNGCYGP